MVAIFQDYQYLFIFYNPFLLPITFPKFLYLELTVMDQNEEAETK